MQRIKAVATMGLGLLAALVPQDAPAKAKWKAALYGRSTDDTFSSSRTVGAAFIVRADHSLSDSLEALLLGGVLLETGSSAALFTDEFEPKSRLQLQEASLRWKVFGPVSLKGGALDQSYHKNPLFLDGGTFPAALLAFNPAASPWILHLSAQAAIPTSRSLSTRATGKENTPLLFTQTAAVGWKSGDTQWLLKGTAFQFRDLTRGVAQDSRFYGNTVTGIGAASRFVYQYEGFTLGPELRFAFSRSLSLLLGGNYLQNPKGPTGHNRGIHAYTGFEYRGESFTLAPKIEYYRNEADSSPAFYTSPEFGHNNRKGAGAGFKLALPKAGVEIEAKYRRSRLITPRTFQKDRFDYLELVVEIPYAGF